MNTEQLKDVLVSELGSKYKLANPKVQSKRFIALSFLIIILLTLSVGIREDFSYIFKSTQFYIELIILLTLVYTLVLTTIESATPGVKVLAKISIITTLISLWPIYLFFFAEEQVHPLVEEEYSCSRMVVISTILFGAFFFAMISKNYSTKPKTTVFLGTFTCSTIGGFILHLVCPGTTFNHLFTWHFLPIIGIPLAMITLFIFYQRIKIKS
jgi:hypothetical protein